MSGQQHVKLLCGYNKSRRDSLSLVIRGMSRHGDSSLLDFHRKSRRGVTFLISLVTSHGGRFQPELNFNLSLLGEQ